MSSSTSTVAPPAPPPQNHYNDYLPGVYGELGPRALRARYLQTAATIERLDKLTLICELPDSEKWPVRQLFQRDINWERVDEGLIPYFKNAERTKFFNPLTIAVLPIQGGRVIESVQETESIETWSGYRCEVREAVGYYKLTRVVDAPQYSKLEWNTDRVKLVAVDGQHRLSALKRMRQEYLVDSSNAQLSNVDFASWTIPVVVLVAPVKDTQNAPSAIDSIRDVFVTINTHAQKPTRARTILLNDFSVTAMCCQELLEHSHVGAGSEDLPLIYFDWRAHKDGESVESPVAFLRIEELEDLHIHFLLTGDDGERPTTRQKDALFINDMDPPLNERDRSVTQAQIRARYREVMMPAVKLLLTGFEPFRPYLQAVRTISRGGNNDYQVHALSQLRFGTTYAPDHLRSRVDEEVQKYVGIVSKSREAVPSLFLKLVGLRGLFSGFQIAKKSYENALSRVRPWYDLAEWYLRGANEAFQSGAFDLNNRLLRHVVIDHADKIVNYRLTDVSDALGAYFALYVLAADKENREVFEDEILLRISTLESTLMKGYRREFRPLVKEKHPDKSPDDQKRLVDEIARKRVDQHLEDLAKSIHLDWGE